MSDEQNAVSGAPEQAPEPQAVPGSEPQAVPGFEPQAVSDYAAAPAPEPQAVPGYAPVPEQQAVPGYAPVPEQQAVPGYGAGYQQEAYQQPPYQQQPYQQTAYQQPYPPVSLGIGSAKKDKWVAAVLAFLLGWCGIHKFYLGYKNEGIAMLVIGIVGAICTLGLGTFVIGVIAIIEAVRYLILTQEDFEQRYVINRRGWF